MVYFVITVCNSDCVASNGWTVNETSIGKDVEGKSCGLLNSVITRKSWGKWQKPPVRIGGILVTVWIRHVPNASQKRNHPSQLAWCKFGEDAVRLHMQFVRRVATQTHEKGWGGGTWSGQASCWLCASLFAWFTLTVLKMEVIVPQKYYFTWTGLCSYYCENLKSNRGKRCSTLGS